MGDALETAKLKAKRPTTLPQTSSTPSRWLFGIDMVDAQSSV
jgi:hypothetical protein